MQGSNSRLSHLLHWEAFSLPLGRTEGESACVYVCVHALSLQ